MDSPIWSGPGEIKVVQAEVSPRETKPRITNRLKKVETQNPEGGNQGRPGSTYPTSSQVQVLQPGPGVGSGQELCVAEEGGR